MAEAIGPPQLLRPGQYHDNEVTAVTGERWLALVRDPRGTDRLVAVTLAVDKVRDEVVDADGPVSGKRVSALPGGDSIAFLVRNVSGLREGAVTALATDANVSPGQPIRVSVDRASYEIALECGAPHLQGGTEVAACSLLVRRGLDAQVVRTYEAYFENGVFVAVGDDALPRVLWAGDLDRDGALDLLIDLTDHYNVSRPTLFLSRGHSGDTLLERVAEFVSVGC